MSDSNEREIRIPSQKRSIAKRNTILSAAKEMFLEEGYMAVNTNEIAKKAGVSVGTLYSYFKDKREIFLCIMEDCNADFRELCKKSRVELNVCDDPMVTLERFFDVLMSALSVYGGLFKEYLNHVAASVEEKRKFFSEQNKIMFQILLELLNEWGDKLRVKDKEVSTLMVLELGFTVADQISSGYSPVPPEVLKQEMLDTVHRYLFK